MRREAWVVPLLAASPACIALSGNSSWVELGLGPAALLVALALPVIGLGAGPWLWRLRAWLGAWRAPWPVGSPDEYEQLFRSVLENSLQGILVLQDEKPVFINAAFAQILGFESPQALYDPQTLAARLPPAEAERVRGYRDARLSGAQAPSHFQSQAIRKDGSQVWLDHVVSVVRWRGKPAVQVSVMDVTGRRAAQQQLEERERIQAYAQEIAHVGAWEWDLRTGIATHTAEAIRIMGIDPVQPFSFDAFIKAVHPDDRELVQRRIVDMLKHDAPYHVEFRVTRPDGSLRHISSKGSALRDETGRAIRSIGVIQDITEQKLVQLALEESQGNLARAQSIANMGSWTWNIPENRVDWSAGLFKVLGHEPGDLECSLRSMLSFVHPDDIDEFLGHFRNAATRGLPYQFDHRIRRRDGALRIVRQRADVYTDAAGKPLNIVGVVQDVTERTLAEEAFRDSERALAMAQELAHLGSWSVHLPTGAVRWSDETYRILGMEPGAFPGNLEALLPFLLPEERSQVQKRAHALVSRSEPFDMEHRLVRPNGEQRTVHSQAVVFRNKAGIPEHIVGAVHDITERKRSETALRESERNYRTLVEHSVQGIAIVQDHIVRFANQALADILGFERAPQLIGRNALQTFVAPQSQEFIRTVHGARMVGGSVPSQYEFQALRRDGTRIWLDCMATLVTWEGAPATQATYVDITHRKLAEQMLRESEQKYRNLLEHSLPGIAITQRERYIYVNKAFCEIFGYSEPTEITDGGYLLMIVAPEDRPRLKTYREDRLAGRPAPDRYEFRGLRRDGTLIWVECMASLVSWDGQPAIQISYLDITERKQSEEALSRFARAMDQAQEAIFIMDTDGRVDYVNAAFERVTGYSREEALGKPFQTLGVRYGGAGPDKDGWHFTRVAGSSWEGRSRNMRKDGTPYDVECSVSPVRDAGGHLVYYVSVQKDVSQQVLLEEQLRRSQRMEAIGTLAGGIAHDFNNLLVPIIGFTELALEEEPPASQRHRDLTEVSRAAYRARDLVTQILHFSRKTESARTRISLVPVVQEVLALIRVTLPKSIEVRRLIDPDTAFVDADSTQLHQVIMNLCVNAAQAMPDGGQMTVSLDNVTVQERRLYSGQVISGRYVRFRVQDTGVGMDEQTMQHAVEPFFTTKEIGKGTGLGLSTVYGIVQQHEGHLNILSRPGQGSTFEVYLPALRALPEERFEAVLRMAGGSERILLVDDEAMVTSLYRRVLERLGYVVEKMNDPRVALRRFLEQPDDYDLAIVDQTMPALAGDRLVDKLRAVRPDLPIILCTGFSDTMTPERAGELGINAFFYKPNAPYDLGRMVRTVLDRAARPTP